MYWTVLMFNCDLIDGTILGSSAQLAISIAAS